VSSPLRLVELSFRVVSRHRNTIQTKIVRLTAEENSHFLGNFSVLNTHLLERKDLLLLVFFVEKSEILKQIQKYTLQERDILCENEVIQTRSM
jgi:hypothetical protein